MKKESSDRDLDFNCRLEVCPLIPEGIYEVGFIRAEKKWMWGGWKIFLWFKILTFGDFCGVNLYRAFNLPERITDSSEYYRAWLIAVGRKPDRKDRMGTGVFRNKQFEVEVRTVILSSKQRKLTREQQYSVIGDINRKIAG